MNNAVLRITGLLLVLMSPMANCEAQGDALEPTKVQSLIAQMITTYGNRLHYAKPAHDDALSEKIFSNYLDQLDPARDYLQEEDIVALDKYRRSLDDALKLGNVKPAFDIYNSFRARLVERSAEGLAAVDGSEVFTIFMNTYLASLDPHSAYFPARNPGSDALELSGGNDRPERERQPSSHILDNLAMERRIGVVRVRTMPADESAVEDIREEINRLQQEGMEGLMLDLRGNMGGTLQGALDLTGLFLSDVPVVQLKTSTGKQEVLESNDDVAWDEPLLVLVDGNTAAAAEILAAAIQDHGAGIIAGTRTQGMGTIQKLFDLNRQIRGAPDLGDLKLTVGMYYRVSGAGIQIKGIKPDVVLPSMLNENTIREENRRSALPWESVGSLKNVAAPVPVKIIETLNGSLEQAPNEIAQQDAAVLEAAGVLASYIDLTAR